MTEHELIRAIKPITSGEWVDITIRYQLRNKDGAESTFGYIEGKTTHCLYIDTVLDHVQKIERVKE